MVANARPKGHRTPGPVLDLVVTNTSEVVTCSADPRRGAEAAIAPILGGVVGIRSGRIAFLGPERNLPSGAVGRRTLRLDAGGGFVGPGFVDAHTHLVFAGDRASELEARIQGKSYQQIGQEGGGILSTVRSTRAASEEELTRLALRRTHRLLAEGVTTAEAKSGYGLNVDDELKILRAIRRLGTLQPIELVPTLLCAHALPEEARGRRRAYLELCVKEILPEVARQGLARFCDAFVEEGAFSAGEARTLLEAARELGMGVRLHADQLTPGGGAQLAAELGAASADHLEKVSARGIRALARGKVAATLLPVSTLFLGLNGFAPGRRLWDAGVTLALGTNLNPGSAMSESFAANLGLACLKNGLTPAEAYWAATRGGALALGLEEFGKLEVGGPADLAIFTCRKPRHLPYHFAIPHVRAVVKAGRLAWESPALHPVCV